MTGIIAEAFIAACRDELQAPKPGNVHVYAHGHRMTVAQFEDSAAAAAGPLCAPGARVGVRIRGAIAATFEAVGANTNLGIVLLCAPLAAAADPTFPTSGDGNTTNGKAPPALRNKLIHVLNDLDVVDAAGAFAAIVQASPAGLGRAEQHDVFATPQITLKQAMAEAADRDRVARQYATGFADVFEVGLPLHVAAATRWSAPEWATLAVYLGFLSRFPDSHIVRKYGPSAAAEVCRTAQKFDAMLGKTEDPVSLVSTLLAWDENLKAHGLNPGTTADLTVATMFGIRLQSVLPSARISG